MKEIDEILELATQAYDSENQSNDLSQQCVEPSKELSSEKAKVLDIYLKIDSIKKQQLKSVRDIRKQQIEIEENIKQIEQSSVQGVEELVAARRKELDSFVQIQGMLESNPLEDLAPLQAQYSEQIERLNTLEDQYGPLLAEFKKAEETRMSTYEQYVTAFSKAFLQKHPNQTPGTAVAVADHIYDKAKKSNNFVASITELLQSQFPSKENAMHQLPSNTNSNSKVSTPKATTHRLALEKVSPKNWPDYVGLELGFAERQENLLSREQYNEIRKLAQTLEREIKSFWPYPNKDRKQKKIDALASLISNICNDSSISLEGHIAAIKIAYPQAVIGDASHRVRSLFEDLETSNPAHSSIINF